MPEAIDAADWKLRLPHANPSSVRMRNARHGVQPAAPGPTAEVGRPSFSFSYFDPKRMEYRQQPLPQSSGKIRKHTAVESSTG